MAAISRVFSIRRVAQMLGHDEDLLWELADQLEPEDGKIWVYDADEVETLASTGWHRKARGDYCRPGGSAQLRTS